MNESIKIIADFVDNASDGIKNAGSAVKDFYQGLVEGAKAELDAISANKKLGDSASDATPKIQSLASELTSLAAKLYTAKQLVDAFVDSIKEADKLDDLSQKTGIAASSLNTLGYAAKQSGSSLDGIVGAFNKLGRAANMSEEDMKKQSQAFETLGVSATDSNGQIKQSEELFLELADAFQGIEEGPEKAAIAFRLFGSEAKNLMPMLNLGAQGIKDLRAEAEQLGGMSADRMNAFAKASGDLMDNLDKLGTVFKGMFNQMNAELVPVFNIFLDALVESSKEGGLLRDVIDGLVFVFNSGLVPVVKFAGTILAAFGSTVKIVAKGLGAIGAAMALLLQGEFSAAKQVFSDYADDVAQIAAEHTAFQDKLGQSGKAVEDLDKKIEKRKIKTLGKDIKEVKSELQGMLDALLLTNQAFGQDDSVKQTLDAQAKYYKDVKTLGQDRAAALYAEVDAQIQLNKSLRDGATEAEAFKKAQTSVEQMQAANAEIAFEVTLVGKSADERARLIDLHKEEIKLLGIKKGLTDADAATIAQQGADAITARGELLKTRDEAKITNDILDKSRDAITADVQRRLIIATNLLESGKITVDDYSKYVDDQMNRLKDKTKVDLSEMQVFWQEAGKGIQNSLQSTIFDFMQGKLTDMGAAVKRTIDQIVAQMLAAKIATSMFGDNFAKGQMGGLVGQGMSFLSGLFGGARASGGPVQAGRAYMVGERGPEPFIPSVSGTIIPNAAMQQSQNFNFSITAIDSKDFLAKMSEVKREVADMMSSTNRSYGLRGA